MNIYLDESGDLGWSFDRPFRVGGSSRYLTLAFLVLPDPHSKKPKKVISKLYKKYSWGSEKKATDASFNQKIQFCESAKALLTNCPEIKIDVITVKKSNVQAHIRNDANKLYNYMAGLIIPEYVAKEPDFNLIVDERSLKVKSQNSLSDYVQIKLWFDIKCISTLRYIPVLSENNYNIQFIDWVSHCVWKKYEDNEGKFFEILRGVVRIRELFF